MTSSTIERAVAALALAFPRQDWPKASQELYARMLTDIPGEILMGAVEELIATKTFLPSVAEIRSAAAMIQQRAAGVLDAYSAWEEVTSQMRRVGHTGRPSLDDLTMRAVNAVGGWYGLCVSDNPAADRARFVDAYNTFAKRGEEELVRLPGVKRLIEQMGGGRRQLPEAVPGYRNITEERLEAERLSLQDGSEESTNARPD